MSALPTMFVGSSSERLEVAEAIQMSPSPLPAQGSFISALSHRL